MDDTATEVTHAKREGEQNQASLSVLGSSRNSAVFKQNEISIE